MKEQPELPPPWVNGPEVPVTRADCNWDVAHAGEPCTHTSHLKGDRDERRLVAAAVRLLMRLPRVARYGLLALALAGGAEVSGGLDLVLDTLFGPNAELFGNSVEQPNRSHRPELRLERADAETLHVR